MDESRYRDGRERDACDRTSVVAVLAWKSHPADMHSLTAYERRETLRDNDLVRLKAALIGEVGRYRDAIRGYSPEKMQHFGEPHLTKLQARVDEVARIQAQRASAS